MRRSIFFFAGVAICIAIVGLWVCWRSRCCCWHSHCGIAAVAEEKHFCVIIPSYNNQAFVEKNLQSVFSQNYDHFRVIYVDDHSSDATFEKAKQLVQQLHQEGRTTLIQNSSNLGGLANIYKAVHSCSDDEIAVLVDGDDFLAHENVLKILNETYANPEVWLTYGSYLDYPSYKSNATFSKPIPHRITDKNSYRTYEFCSSHLRTFYASLFKQIKIEDLFYRGKFFPMGWDLAFMLPMLEMSGPHARHISDVLYLYNRNNPLSDHNTNIAFQQECANAVRDRHSYDRLSQLPKNTLSSGKADLLIFSYNRPMQLQALLESIDQMMEGIDRLLVLYRADPPFESAYEQLLVRFPKATWIAQKEAPNDFQTLCEQAIFSENSSPYILFAVDDMVVKESVDLKECIAALEDTKAYGFYLSHSLALDTCYMLNRYQGIPPHLPLNDTVYAWQFNTGSDDWAYPNSVDMVLYRKKDILKDFKKIAYQNPYSLESSWNLRAKKERVGLFYATSKALNLPLNLVISSDHAHSKSYTAAELLDKFKAGLKIDISPLRNLQNRSRHLDYEVTFIPDLQHSPN